MNKNNNIPFPDLPEEKIRKMAKELSDPNLEPKPSRHDWESEFKCKMNEVAKELAERIENEKKAAYQMGLVEGKKSTKKL